MKLAVHRACVLIVASVFIAVIGGACSSGAASSASSAGDPEPSASASKGSATVAGKTLADSNSIVFFQDNGDGAKLAADMQSGAVPLECDVLYDQMGALPAVTVTDPDAVADLYDLLKAVQVVNKSDMSITDSYHHVFFTLQDGTRVGYSFEGEGTAVLGNSNYRVVGDGPLWSYVRQLQGGDAANASRHAVTVSDDEDIVSHLPKTAAAGDTVAFSRLIVLDASSEVFLDGKLLNPVPDVSWLYTFTMPDHDVAIETRLVDDLGGS